MSYLYCHNYINYTKTAVQQETWIHCKMSSGRSPKQKALAFSLFSVFKIRLNNHLELNFPNQTNSFKIFQYYIRDNWKGVWFVNVKILKGTKILNVSCLRLTLCRSRLENLVSKKLMRSNFRCKKEKDASSVSTSSKVFPGHAVDPLRRGNRANRPSVCRPFSSVVWQIKFSVGQCFSAIRYHNGLWTLRAIRAISKLYRP